MSRYREPVLKRCRYLGISPTVIGIDKESNRKKSLKRQICPKVDIKSHLMYNFGMDNFNNLTLSIILQEEKVFFNTLISLIYLANKL